LIPTWYTLCLHNCHDLVRYVSVYMAKTMSCDVPWCCMCACVRVVPIYHQGHSLSPTTSMAYLISCNSRLPTSTCQLGNVTGWTLMSLSLFPFITDALTLCFVTFAHGLQLCISFSTFLDLVWSTLCSPSLIIMRYVAPLAPHTTIMNAFLASSVSPFY
jgi:hypothetical protein